MSVPHEDFAAMRAERDRVCSHPMFKRSPVLRRLLDYLVEHCANNNSASPKAYAIALDVLGRGDDFDPATDSYPRVMVGRLRGLLNEYYQKVPSPARLEIPTGAYSVILKPQQSLLDERAIVGEREFAGGERQSGWFRIPPKIIAVALAVAAMTLVIGGYFLWPLTPKPASDGQLIVIADTARQGSGDESITTQLAGRRLNDLILGFGHISERSSVSDLNNGERRVAFRLTSEITKVSSGQITLTVRLAKVQTNQSFWSRRGVWTANDEDNELLLKSIASEIAGEYGVLIRNHLRNNQRSYRPGVDCLAQSSQFRRVRDASMIAPLEKCLTNSIAKFPELPALYRDSLSFVLFAKFEADPTAIGARTAAIRAADDAFALAGLDSDIANFAMARRHFFTGNCKEGARQLRAANSKNPANGERLAFGGTYLFMCRNPEAEVVLRRAIALDGDRASLALVILAYVELRDGNGQAALDLIDQVLPSMRQEPQVDLVRAAAMHDLGRFDESAAIMAKLRTQLGVNERTPADVVLRKFISNPRTIAVLSNELRRRGLQP